MSENVKFVADLDPTNVEQGADKIDQALAGVAGAADKAKDGLKRTLDVTAEATKGLERGTGALRGMQQGLEQLDPQLAKTVKGLADIADGASKGAKLGEMFGPGGLVVGAFVGGLIPALEASAKAQKDFEDATNKATEAGGRQGITLLQTTIHDLEATRAAWTTSAQERYEIDQRLVVAREQLRILDEQNNTAAEVRARRARMEADTQRAEENGAIAYRLEQADLAHRQRLHQQAQSAAQKEQARIHEENRDRLESLMDGWAQEEEDYQTHLQEMARTHSQAIIAQQARDRDAFALHQRFRQQAEAREEQQLQRANDNYQNALNQQKAEEEQNLNERNQAQGQYIGDFVGGLEQVVATSIEAAESTGKSGDAMAKAVLDGIAKAAEGKAVMEGMEAVANYAAYAGTFFTAAPLLTAAIGHTAAAVGFAAIGGGSAAISSAIHPSSGGTGPGHSTGASMGSGGVTRGSGVSGGSGTVTNVTNIHFNGTVLGGSPREIGKQVRYMQDAVDHGRF